VIGGPGCPDAATQLTVSPDGRTITVQASAFETGLATDASVARVNCSVAAPFTGVPAGMRLVITEASAVGSYSLAQGASGQASLEAFFAGQTSTPAVLSEGSADAPTQGELDVRAVNAAIGGCASDGIVRLNASLVATQTPPGSSASSLSFGLLQLHLDLAPCE
jgi:hypothetical protein